jgi:hypothetical protein
MTVKAVRPKREDKLGIKQAGLAIRKKSGEGRRILGTSRQVEHYAFGEFFEPPPGSTFAEVEKMISDHKIEAIVLYLRDLRNFEAGLLEHVERKYPRVGEFPDPPREGVHPVRVYRVPPP